MWFYPRKGVDIIMNNFKSLFKKSAFKHGAFSLIFTILFIVLLVGVNVFATYMVQRFPIDIDLTIGQTNTVGVEYAEIIKKVDAPINITVVMTREDYSGGYYSYILNQYGVADESGGKYFEQTVRLLDELSKINSKISVDFLDFTKPEADLIAQKYNNLEQYLMPGDIIVESAENETQYKILSYDSIYKIIENQYGYYDTIAGSSFEYALTNAIYLVASNIKNNAVYFTGYGCAPDTSFLSKLAAYNYDVSSIDNLLVSDIPENTDVLILFAPTKDMTEDEVNKLFIYMYDVPLQNKHLIYFSSANSPSLPNLEKALSIWGFEFSAGTVYENDSNKHASANPSLIFLENSNSDFTKSFNENTSFYIKNMKPVIFTNKKDSEYMNISILKSSDTSYIVPPGSSDISINSNSVKGPFEAVGLSRYTKKFGDVLCVSNVLVVSGLDYINSEFNAYASSGNMRLMINLVNTLAGRDNEGIGDDLDDTKEITYELYIPSESTKTFLLVTFGFVFPLAVVVTGCLVYRKRKRR